MKLQIHQPEMAAAVAALMLALLSPIPLLANAALENPEQQRALFLQAEQALKEGERTKYRDLLSKLQEYPLYPYLLYQDLSLRLATAENAELSRFFHRYSNTPLAGMLRKKLLKQRAKEGRWREYLMYYVPLKDTLLRCHYRTALLKTGRRTKALRDIKSLWLVGHPQPDACDPIFEEGRKAGIINHRLIRKRAYLALKKGRYSLARYLGKQLSRAERDRISRLSELRKNPEQVTTIRTLGNEPEATRQILIQAIYRLSGKDFEQAESAWNTLQNRFSFTAEEKAGTIRRLGMRLAWRHDPEALKWLTRIPSRFTTPAVRHWRVRTALRQGDWKQTLYWLNKLTPKERAEEEWRYWRARALENLGRQHKANEIYQELAKNRSYYGFLAADRLGQPYRFIQRPLQFAPSDIEGIAKIPAMRRAAELYRLERIVSARREWNLAISHLKGDDLLKAALLADSWGWHDRVIVTLGKTSHRDDLDRRFPLAYREQIFREALRKGIDPAWVYGLIRQESAFMADVRSPAGALGLMQLMPSTARQVARQIRFRVHVPSDILKPDTNIRLGITYLSKRYRQFGRNTVLATAAYNAGAHRVNRWLPEENPVTADRWIESIPFNETRKYVKRVLTYTAIYEQRLGQTPIRLQERMPPIPGDFGSG